MLTRSMLARSIRVASTKPMTSTRALRTTIATRLHEPRHATRRAASHASPDLVRWMSSRTVADEKIEYVTELYYSAQDEFEMAMEETEANSSYAEEDRKAARDELVKVQAAYKKVVEGSDADLARELERKLGGKLLELEQSVTALEQLAINQDSST